MNLEELLRQAKDGNMVAQYDLAEYYGKLLKETDNEDEIFNYSREAMLWLKKSAKQGYGPAMDAVSELNVRPEAADKADEMDVAAETMAAAVAAAMDGLDAGYPAAEAPVPEKRASAAEPIEPEERPAGGSSGANLALACMLGISLLLNILLLIFLFKLTRERRVQPAPTPPVISEAPMTTPEFTPEPTPEVTPEPTPEATPEPTPTVTEEPFWLDLTAYPDLELKPAQDELYDDYDYYVVTADSLNVRSGPDTRYRKLGTVSEGTKLGAVSKYGTWYLVNFAADEFGWVSGQYLTDDLSWTPPVATAAPVSTPEPTPAATSEPVATPSPTPAATSAPAPESTPEATPEVTPEATPEPTSEPTPEEAPEPTRAPGGLASPGNLRG